MLAFHLAQKGHRLVRVWSDMPTDGASTHKGGTEIEWPPLQYHPCHAYTLVCQLAKNHGNNVTVMVGQTESWPQTYWLPRSSRGNGKEQSDLRRNKFLQIEAVRSRPDAPFQAQVQSAEEVETGSRGQTFSEPFKAVVKPVDGAGSDGVTICDSRDEVRRALPVSRARRTSSVSQTTTCSSRSS